MLNISNQNEKKHKILFLIHDLGQGGAEKVLVNLVNNMDQEKFDITVIALFGGGVNEQFLAQHINYKTIYNKSFPGNSKLMKLFTPQQLHKKYIRDKYDIEISYLEGPSARIISGCKNTNTKLVSWIHVQQENMVKLASSFRNAAEAKSCYERFHQTVCVSEYIKQDFIKILDFKGKCDVLYNTVESEIVLNKSQENIENVFDNSKTNLVAVGTLKKSKGYERLLSVIEKLSKEKYSIHLYILGIGPLQDELLDYVKRHDLDNTVSFLGYQINPYKYVAKSDLFVCASYAEGFSTAATESLIVGTPVCTVEVSGMKEMLGAKNEYGLVTENDEVALYQGIKMLLDDPELLKHYKRKAFERGKMFSTESTVKAVEKMLLNQ